MASAVFFPESGEPIVGEAAINAGEYAPERLVRQVKAFMGTNWRARIGGREYSPPEISGEILKVLRRNAETYLGIAEGDLAGVVLAVPAYFSDAAIEATLEAAVLGGFDRNKVRLFPEPSAVALCYTAESLGEFTSGSRFGITGPDDGAERS
jgi:molecular chaperone DnaK